jgi:transcriptional regulator with XRE-family HTH domain
MDAMERLRSYVIERRAELRLSQRELAKVSGVKAATIASIEAGRVARAPDLETLEPLAKGLKIPAEFLIALARGKSMEEAWGIVDALKRTPLPTTWAIPSDVADPADDWELAVIKKIEHIDWGDLDPRRDESFWYHDRADRRRLFRFWEAQAEEQEELRRKRGLS